MRRRSRSTTGRALRCRHIQAFPRRRMRKRSTCCRMSGAVRGCGCDSLRQADRASARCGRNAAMRGAGGRAVVCDGEHLRRERRDHEHRRERGIYTADGATRYRDQLFYVARALFDAPCGEESFLAQYPILRDRMPRKVANATAFLDRAWGEIESRLRAKNLDPFRIVDPGPFEPVQAAYAAAFLAENLSAAATEADEWGSKAIAWMRYADAAFDRVLANLDWYDEDQDMLPGADEQRVRSRVLALR